jgi:hypothetical protein
MISCGVICASRLPVHNGLAAIIRQRRQTDGGVRLFEQAIWRILKCPIRIAALVRSANTSTPTGLVAEQGNDDLFVAAPAGAVESHTKDDTTVAAKVEQIQKEYGISQLHFVGDWGMITEASNRQLEEVLGLQTISALPHR